MQSAVYLKITNLSNNPREGQIGHTENTQDVYFQPATLDPIVGSLHPRTIQLLLTLNQSCQRRYANTKNPADPSPFLCTGNFSENH
jgi:hypothetical protein